MQVSSVNNRRKEMKRNLTAYRLSPTRNNTKKNANSQKQVATYKDAIGSQLQLLAQSTERLLKVQTMAQHLMYN